MTTATQPKLIWADDLEIGDLRCSIAYSADPALPGVHTPTGEPDEPSVVYVQRICVRDDGDVSGVLDTLEAAAQRAAERDWDERQKRETD